MTHTTIIECVYMLATMGIGGVIYMDLASSSGHTDWLAGAGGRCIGSSDLLASWRGKIRALGKRLERKKWSGFAYISSIGTCHLLGLEQTLDVIGILEPGVFFSTP